MFPEGQTKYYPILDTFAIFIFLRPVTRCKSGSHFLARAHKADCKHLYKIARQKTKKLRLRLAVPVIAEQVANGDPLQLMYLRGSPVYVQRLSVLLLVFCLHARGVCNAAPSSHRGETLQRRTYTACV